jgi:hypothetical protein
VSFERQSEWQTTALLSTAIETMTLPARLRSIQGKRESLDELETVLNVNGNQRIFGLQSSIGHENVVNAHSANERRSMMNGHPKDSRGQEFENSLEHDSTEASYDIDFTPDVLGTMQPRRVHYFGRVEVDREAFPGHEVSTSQDEHESLSRLRRLQGEPNQKWYVITLPIVF